MYKNQKVLALVVIFIFLIIFVAVAATRMGNILKKDVESNLPPPTPEATPDSSTTTGSEEEKACDKLLTQDLKDECYSQVGRQKHDSPICGKIQNQEVKDHCYFNLINFEKDSAICGKIQEQMIKDGCYYDVASWDPLACDKIPDHDLKDACYSKISKLKQDLSICEKIQNQEARGFCLTDGQGPEKPISALLSEWKTFTNEKHKYSFKYPSPWVFRLLYLSPPNMSKLRVIREEITNRSEYNMSSWSIKIAAWDNPSNLPLADWLKIILQEPGGLIPKDIPSIPNTVMGKAEIAALKTWIGGMTWDKPGKCYQACPTLDFYFVHKDKAYRVEMEGSDAAKKENQEIFKQILSTFEFID